MIGSVAFALISGGVMLTNNSGASSGGVDMNTSEMTARIAQASPQSKARIAGACWLMTFLTSMYAMFVGGRLVVSGDAAATAANLLSHESLFRSGSAAILISTAFYLAVTVLVYELLKPVNRTISLLAAFFSLAGCAVGALGCLFDLVPFVLLRGGQYLSVFTVEQLQALALMFLKVRVQANDNIALVFFGLHCLLVGCLILISTFLPRIIGALMVLAGLGWLTFLAPPVARSLSPYIMLPGAVGELSLTLWLLVKGVNVERWNEQTRAAAES